MTHRERSVRQVLTILHELSDAEEVMVEAEIEHQNSGSDETFRDLVEARTRFNVTKTRLLNLYRGHREVLDG